MLSFLNSKLLSKLIQVISPTLNYEQGSIKSLPILLNIEYDKKQNIDVSVLNGLLENCNSKEHADVELAVYNSLKKLVQA